MIHVQWSCLDLRMIHAHAARLPSVFIQRISLTKPRRREGTSRQCLFSAGRWALTVSTLPTWCPPIPPPLAWVSWNHSLKISLEPKPGSDFFNKIRIESKMYWVFLIGRFCKSACLAFSWQSELLNRVTHDSSSGSILGSRQSTQPSQHISFSTLAQSPTWPTSTLL